MIVTLLALGLLFVPSSHAFFRLPCAQPVLNARVDPIVSPGKPSGHMHSIMGSGGTHTIKFKWAGSVYLISHVSHWDRYYVR
jgi:hypothetical protein